MSHTALVEIASYHSERLSKNAMQAGTAQGQPVFFAAGRVSAVQRRRRRLMAGAWAVGLLIAGGGCGSNAQSVLSSSAGAAGRTVLDLLLTELMNAFADALYADGDKANDNAPPPNGNTDGSPTEPPPGVIGQPAAGLQLYTANICAVCHCADARGGCALAAPDLAGAPYGEVFARLRGDKPHTGGKFDFSEQQLADLAAYFDTLENP